MLINAHFPEKGSVEFNHKCVTSCVLKITRYVITILIFQVKKFRVHYSQTDRFVN